MRIKWLDVGKTDDTRAVRHPEGRLGQLLASKPILHVSHNYRNIGALGSLQKTTFPRLLYGSAWSHDSVLANES